MNIIWLTTQFPNGEKNRNGMFIYRTIIGLSKIHNISVIVLHPVIPPILPMLKNLKKWKTIHSEWKEKFPVSPQKPAGLENIKVQYAKFVRPPRIGNQFYEGWLAYFSVKNLLKKNKSKYIIHANWIYPEGMAAYLMSRKFNIPFLITLRGHDINDLKVNSKDWRFAQKIIDAAKMVTSVSSTLLDISKDKGINIPYSKRAVTHNFYDFNSFAIKDRFETRRDLKVITNEFIILAAGNLNPRKNFDLLIRGIAELVNKEIYTQLFIAGGGLELFRLKDLANNLKINDRVHFLGDLDAANIVNYYNAADLFCLPSKHEGLANVIIEALLCGTPAVVSAVNEAPKIISNGENGFLVEPNSLESLVEGIKKSIDCEWDRSVIRESISFLSDANVGKEFSAIYDKFL